MKHVVITPPPHEVTPTQPHNEERPEQYDGAQSTQGSLSQSISDSSHIAPLRLEGIPTRQGMPKAQVQQAHATESVTENAATPASLPTLSIAALPLPQEPESKPADRIFHELRPRTGGTQRANTAREQYTGIGSEVAGCEGAGSDAARASHVSGTCVNMGGAAGRTAIGQVETRAASWQGNRKQKEIELEGGWSRTAVYAVRENPPYHSQAHHALREPLPQGAQDPAEVARRIGVHCIEILKGHRPLAHIRSWVDPKVFAVISRRTSLALHLLGKAPKSQAPRARCLSLRWIQPRCVEAVVVVDDRRQHLLAMRLEYHRGKWQMCALEME